MRKRIVIADDHPVFLIGLRAVIENSFGAHYNITGEATSVDQLLTVLGQEPPEVLLTDFSMPGEHADGLRLIEQLRRKYPDMRLVVITGMGNPALAQAMLANGAYRVISKTELTAELTLCLKDILQGRARAEPLAQNNNLATISPRELEVIRLLGKGHTVNQIAEMLNRTKQTISAQKKSAMSKLDIKSDADLFEYLRMAGL
jgi:two-component system capsular synthesis response regulator RcsB